VCSDIGNFNQAVAVM